MVVLLVVLLVSTASFALEVKQVPDGFSSPGLSLQDLEGKTQDLKDYQGQVVLLQFWATYRTPCRKEMPSMNRLMKKMEGTPFTILAVNMGGVQG